IHAAGDPVIAVLVAPAAVAGEIGSGIVAEVSLHEAIVIAEERPRLPWPAVEDHQIALSDAFEKHATVIDDPGAHAEEGKRRRAWLQIDGARQRRDEDPAVFRLPPRVDDGAPPFAHHAMIPLPGLRIDRLADAAEEAQ